jgi:hypothetical protein
MTDGPCAPGTSWGLTATASEGRKVIGSWGARTGDSLNTMTSRAESTGHAAIVHTSSSTYSDIGLDMIEDPLIDAIEAADVGQFNGN